MTGGQRGTNKPCATLGRALQLAQPTDEIVVNPGTYRNVGPLFVSTSNVFISAYGATFLSSSTAVNVLTIAAPDCTVAGLTIDGGRTTEASSVNCGLINVQADRALVQDCTLRNDVGNGVRLAGPIDRPRIYNNNCSNLFCAIQAYGRVNNLDISGNTLTDGWSMATGSGGVKLTMSAYSGGTGSNFLVSNNTITRAGEMGIEAWGGFTQGHVLGNVIRDSTFGISQANVDTSTVSNNQVIGASYCAIELVTSTNLTISNNSFDGIQSDGSSYGTNGIIASNTPGCSQTTINNNSFAHFTYALNLQGTTGFTLSYNTILRDRPGQTAFDIAGCSGTTITGNNVRQTRTDCSYVLFLDCSSNYVDNTNFSDNQVESDTGAYYFSIQGYRNGGTFLVRDTLISNNTYRDATGAIVGYNAYNIPMVTSNPGGIMTQTTVSGNQPATAN